MTGWREWEIKKLTKSRWPESLRLVAPKVKQVYYRGKWDKKIFNKAVAVVGSRRMTKYGEVMAQKLVRGLVEAGYTIVSGFMYGVDTMAHKTCLENKGKTVAILGSGLDCLTPAENDNLYTQILENNGLVMSEFEPKQEAKLWTFPYRNRIVTGLSQAVLVIEAGEKSGSLVTAKWAFKQNIKVMAVPGPATSGLATGTNWLIRNKAVLVSSANEVLQELGESLQGQNLKSLKSQVNLTEEEKQVVELLKNEAMEADELSRKLKKNISEVLVILSNLGLKGVVEESGGKFMIGLGYE
jgi:DNA processing protein